MVGNRNPTISQAGDRKVEKTGVHILLIEDHLAEARLLQEVLKGTVRTRFTFCHVKRLGEAIAVLQATTMEAALPSPSLVAALSPVDVLPVDVILLDLTLPDSYGLDSLDSLIKVASNLPIVVLTNTNDDDLAVEAVRRGAQDYLVKRQINQDILVRSLRYAIERKQAAEALREANEILELRVQRRTVELETSNELLRQEVAWRQTIQERLELAQQAGKIGSFEWNLQSNAITWTAELEALYGLAPGAFGNSHQPWFDTIHTDDRPQLEQVLWQAIQSGQGLDLEFRCLTPRQDIRWIAVKSSIFHDHANHPLRMIGIHMDITEKKQLEAQFLRAQRLESLGTLASGIAHDLNNILTPILAVAQLLPLKLPDLPDQVQQLLQTLETSAHRGADLVKQILSFTRGVEGKRCSLQMHHLLGEISQIIQQTLPKAIAIQTDIPLDLWPIYGDATQLHQVLMNLCVNARDAMPDGGTLQIAAANIWLDQATARLHLDAQAGAYVRITVSDTGLGIAADILHRIFDPFFTTKGIGKGTGLGLSAVLGIVKSHNGFLDVQSVVRQGSQFDIYLPAQSTDDSDQGEMEAVWYGNQELILVIDDETVVSQVITTTLETYNYRVLTASNGMDAIALYAEYSDQIYAVLIDIMMPMMDGFAIVPLLQRINPAIYAIAMSGLSSTEAVAQAERMGFQAFLPKPFTANTLLQLLKLHPSVE